MDFNSYKKVISDCNHIVKVGMVSAYALFLGANTALASVTEYMDQKVSLKTQNCTIESVIQQIEKQTDYLFVYDKNDVDVKRHRICKWEQYRCNRTVERYLCQH